MANLIKIRTTLYLQKTFSCIIYFQVEHKQIANSNTCILCFF